MTQSIKGTACLALCMLAGSSLAASDPVVAGGLSTGELLGPAIRTILGLVAVLAILGVCAWFAQRLRTGGHLKGGLIEIISGVSLGNKEKVVLIRVGSEQIVVGVSPAGMTSLHVFSDSKSKQLFSEQMEQAE